LFSTLYLSQNSCKPSNFSGGTGSTALGLSFGSGDIGLLNYLLVVEWVQYNFYLKLINSGVFNKTSNTYSLLGDIVNHQNIHYQFYLKTLGTNALTGISLDFSAIDFSQYGTVISNADKFQNVEAQAYNGVAKYFQSSAFLTLTSQIGMVESRHSAYITGLNQSGTFIDSSVVNSSGFENSLSPQAVLTFYKPYIKTALDSTTLPSS